MKRRLVAGVIALTCFSVVAVCAVNAQSANRFEVDVPFAFVFDGQTLQAGKYELARLDPGKPNVLMVKNAETGMLRLLLTQRAERETPGTETYLLFKRLEGKLYLSEIWTRGSMNGIRIPSTGARESRQKSGNSGSSVRLKIKSP